MLRDNFISSNECANLVNFSTILKRNSMINDCFLLAFLDLGIHQISATYNSFTLEWANPTSCGISNMSFSILYNGSQVNFLSYTIIQTGMVDLYR